MITESYPQDHMERLILLLEALIEEHAKTNQFLAQIVAHNADLMDGTDDSEDERQSAQQQVATSCSAG